MNFDAGEYSQRRAKRTHKVQLDGLRAFAVIAVVLDHYGPDGPLIVALEPGRTGVRLFFVLSGFLITGILLDARQEAERLRAPVSTIVRSFYWRRFLRIFPLYYFVLFICLLAGVPSAQKHVWWHLSYTINIYMAMSNSWLSGLGTFWSLAVEEQFYLLWPTIVLFTPRPWLTRVLAGIILIGPLSRGVLAMLTGELIPSEFLMPCCMDSLGAGALLASLSRNEAWSRDQLRRLLQIGFVFGIGLYAILFGLRYTHTGFVAKIIIKDVSCSLLFVYLVYRANRGFTGSIRRILEWRPIVYVGMISYGIYVYHDVLILLDRAAFQGKLWNRLGIGTRGLVPFAVILVTSVLVSSVSWFLLERPLNNLKSRFPYVSVHANRVDAPNRVQRR